MENIRVVSLIIHSHRVGGNRRRGCQVQEAGGWGGRVVLGQAVESRLLPGAPVPMALCVVCGTARQVGVGSTAHSQVPLLCLSPLP